MGLAGLSIVVAAASATGLVAGASDPTPAPSEVVVGEVGGPVHCEADALLFQDAVGSGGSSLVPEGDWTVTKWHADNPNGLPGRLALRVLRPTGQPDSFEVVGGSEPSSVPTGGATTFVLPAPIPVQPGDVVGLWGEQMAPCGAVTGQGGDVYRYANVPLPEVGEVVAVTTTGGGVRVNVAATLAGPDANAAPDCSVAAPTVASLWSPNGKPVPVGVMGVADADADPVTVTVTGVVMDESLRKGGTTSTPLVVDGAGSPIVELPAQRSGQATGRAYQLSFSASDGQGGTCVGQVRVQVAHDQRG